MKRNSSRLFVTPAKAGVHKGWIPAFAGMTAMLFLVSSVFAKPPEMGWVPALQFELPKSEKIILKNGMTVYLLEDHELPLLEMTLKFKASPGDEPKNLRGLLGVMGSVWRTGGTASLSPEVLNEKLEMRAIEIETSAGEESATISLSCLTKDQPESLRLFKEVLLHPAFREDQLALAKGKMLEAIRRKNDGPFEIGRRAFRDVSYGPTHYYAWNPTPAFVLKIKRSDLVGLHKKIICPDQAILAVSGDFDKNTFLAELETLFSDWKSFPRVVPTFDYAITSAPDAKIYYVEKDYTQSLIYMGGLGLSRHSPDQYAMTLTNNIFGDGGPSRLFMQIRSRMGLAYVVGSFNNMPKGPGLAGMVCQTKAVSTLEAILALKDEAEKLGLKPAEPEELRDSKDAIINSFVFRFENSSRIVREQADLEFYGYPNDYLKTYPERIEKVSAAEISETARKYFDFKKMKTVVIGDKKKFGKPLEELGPVLEIPLASIE